MHTQYPPFGILHSPTKRARQCGGNCAFAGLCVSRPLIWYIEQSKEHIIDLHRSTHTAWHGVLVDRCRVGDGDDDDEEKASLDAHSLFFFLSAHILRSLTDNSSICFHLLRLGFLCNRFLLMHDP